MAELADAADLKSAGSSTPVPVRVRPPALLYFYSLLSLVSFERIVQAVQRRGQLHPEDSQPLSSRVQIYDVVKRQLKPLQLCDIIEILNEELGRQVTLNEILNLASQLKALNIGLVGPMDEDYPEVLLELQDPPVLTYLGQLSVLSSQAVKIGIVGSRRASNHSLKLARQISRSLANLNCVIISGLAYGIDREAHLGALDSNGFTVAVLGNGLKVYYPKLNASLQRRIAETGLLLSEYPPHFRPAKWTFPMRNRIIAGLSDILLVISAPKASGALITARYTLELGKPLLIYTASGAEHEGARELLRNSSAIPFTDFDDLISALESLGTSDYLYEAENLNSPDEEYILACFPNSEPITLDELSEKLKMDHSLLLAKLTDMELSGKIARLWGGKYVKL